MSSATLALLGAILGIQFSAYLLYRSSPRNPTRRSITLYPILASSITLWSFLGASLVLCTVFLRMYEWHPQQVVKLVIGSSLVTALGITSLLSLFARRYAFPKMLKSMTAGSFVSSPLSDIFAELCGRMGIQGADLRKAAVGNAFSMGVRGQNIVALAPQLADLLSLDEVEAVLAHELSHLKNGDFLAKGLARLARIAFSFDPVPRLVEAAVHRERELRADLSSVRCTMKPLALASALLKVHSTFRSPSPIAGVGSFVDGRTRGLLSHYPDLDTRIQILIDIAKQIKTEAISA